MHILNILYCSFAVVKMTSSGNFFISEHSQVYIFRKQEFKVSQLMEILIKMVWLG